MISKGELLKKLEDAMAIEERGSSLIISLLRKNFQAGENALDSGGQRLIKIFQVLERDTEGHMRILEELMEDVRSDARDFF